MIPLKDDNPTRSRPWVTILLILGCVAVYFIVQQSATGTMVDQSPNRLTFARAAIPDELTTGEPLSVQEVAGQDPAAAASCAGVTATRTGRTIRLDGADPAAPCFPGKRVYAAMLVSLFLHGSLGHLAFNMLFLWIFGNNIEDRLGHVGYLLFYAAAGAVATIWFVASSPHSTVPLIGASGAIAGIMGAYLVLYPRARILGLFGFFPIRVPAWLFLGFWFFSQFIGGDGAVAYAAHIGGFVFGMLVGLVFRSTGRHRRPAYA